MPSESKTDRDFLDLQEVAAESVTDSQSVSSKTKVKHFGSFLSVAEAAEKLGKSSLTVIRWCETGKLPAIPQPYGRKTTYLISPTIIDAMLVQQQRGKEEKVKKQKAAILPHAEYIEQWLRAMRQGVLNGKVYSPRTIEVYELYVRDFFKRYKVLSINTLELELLRIPADQFGKRDKVFKSLLCLSKWLIRRGALEESFLQEIKKLTPKRHLPPKRPTVNPEGIEKLVTACVGALEKLMVLLLANTGLRASEFVNLRLKDIGMEKRCITVRLGKGNKSRKIGLNDTAFKVLSQYLQERQATSAEDLLLLNRLGKPMDKNGLYQRLAQIGVRAGVKVNPHALRRAFVTINANKGRSLVMLQHACGHSDITTTRSYCLTTEQEVIDAMKDW